VLLAITGGCMTAARVFPYSALRATRVSSAGSASAC